MFNVIKRTTQSEKEIFMIYENYKRLNDDKKNITSSIYFTLIILCILIFMKITAPKNKYFE